MKNIFPFIFGFICLFCACHSKDNSKVKIPEYALVIHGGAGVIERGSLSKQLEESYHKSLEEALLVGENILKAGGSSIDAVEAVIVLLENDSLFNAGKGAVFTFDGKNELDASIMEGREMKAGAVASLTNIKNPITAARAVMEKSPHVLLVREGAEQFAREQKCELVDPSYFYTEKRWSELQTEKAKNVDSVPQAGDNKKMGTVGCVALDKFGDIVAGTSTGGMTNKRYGRVGDSPIIGAGTYADNNTCGVSCTGHGEFFIRYSVAKDVAALMEYKDWSLEKAAKYVVFQKLVAVGGEGGLVAIDNKGNIIMPFNTSGMYRGYCLPGKLETYIYK
ncbi:MAG: isoaspartyl peptidase/L-asparaginase [Saprospiraceae bacterium]